MRANARWAGQTPQFWAYVRVLSEKLGYATKREGIKQHKLEHMIGALESLGRDAGCLIDKNGPSQLGGDLEDYFQYRADLLNGPVRSNLMTAADARSCFRDLIEELKPRALAHRRNKNGSISSLQFQIGGTVIPVPMNKQKGDFKQPNYLTGIVNLLLAYHLDGRRFDPDPRVLPAIDWNGELHAAMSRRMDGAFPSCINPISLWEIKEYYYTTTFGSKISDAVYITSLDGYERRSIETATGQDVEHAIMIDGYDTWWNLGGRPYLCRLIDVLNLGHVDEIMFGKEVLESLPESVDRWISKHSSRKASAPDH